MNVKKQNVWQSYLMRPLLRTFLLLVFAGMCFAAPYAISFSENVDKKINMVGQFLVMLSVAIFAQQVLSSLYRGYLKKNSSLRTYATAGYFLINLFSYGTLILIFLDTVGVSITPLIASLGVGSVAIAFALQETLSNLFSGLYLMADNPIRVGDFVKIESGEEGYVTSIGWRTSHIQTLPNNLVIVPNSRLSSHIIMNYSLPDNEIAVLLDVGVSYNSDLDFVEKVTIEVATDVMKTVTGAIAMFEPFIRYKNFADSSINFTVIMRAKGYVDQFLVKHEFIKKLHKRFQNEGIVIPYPIRTLQIEKSKSTDGTLDIR